MTLRANSTAEKDGSRNTFYYWSTQNIISLSRISVTHKIYYVKIFLNIFFFLPLRLLTLRRILCN